MRKRRRKEKFSPYDTADYLKTEEDIVAYLRACMEDAGNDAAYIAAALSTVTRAREMMRLAAERSASSTTGTNRLSCSSARCRRHPRIR